MQDERVLEESEVKEEDRVEVVEEKGEGEEEEGEEEEEDCGWM